LVFIGVFYGQKGKKERSSSMELQDFIAETLKQIISGVRRAQESAIELGAKINPRGGAMVEMRNVHFDVAVSTSEGTDTKGGIVVLVGPVGSVGSEDQSDVASSARSRIKFSVPLKLPTQPKARLKRRR
jgi:hypothetical protein